MPSWLRKLTLVGFLSILAILLMTGCGTSMEKPLTKEEASQLKESEIIIEAQAPDEDGEQEENEAKDSLTNARDEKTGENSREEQEKTASVQPSDGSNEKNVKKDSHPSEQSPDKSNKDPKEKKAKSAEEKEKQQSPTSPGKNNHGSQAEAPQNSSNTQSDEQKNTIVYSIVISDSEVPLPPTTVEIEEGDTVLDVLIKITKEKGIQMDYRGGRGATAYVEGIANVYEFDRGQGSGWMYRVNGIFPDRGAGVVPVLPGDRVEWLYTTNLGVDLGADLKPFRR